MGTYLTHRRLHLESESVDQFDEFEGSTNEMTVNYFKSIPNTFRVNSDWELNFSVNDFAKALNKGQGVSGG